MTEKRYDVLIARAARIDKTSFEGVRVQQAYYTAGYRDGSSERELGGVNHGATYVIAGKNLRFRETQGLDLLVRDGNGLASIKPEVKAIEQEGEVMRAGRLYDAFRTKRLPAQVAKKIDETLGLTASYEEIRQGWERLGGRHPLLALDFQRLK